MHLSSRKYIHRENPRSINLARDFDRYMYIVSTLYLARTLSKIGTYSCGTAHESHVVPLLKTLHILLILISIRYIYKASNDFTASVKMESCGLTLWSVYTKKYVCVPLGPVTGTLKPLSKLAVPV